MASTSEHKNQVPSKLVPRPHSAPGQPASSKDIPLRFQISNLNFFYGSKQALFDVGLRIPRGKITALIGPSGCGKSTFLRTLNRMNDTIPRIRWTGDVLLDTQDIRTLDVVALRRRVGMVFQRPNPFPKSIFDNWPTACASTGSKAAWPIRSSKACGAPHCGTK